VTRLNEEPAVVTTSATTPDDSPRHAASEPAAGASLDKVRDILFGVQMREFDRRFARLEERLVKETSELKEDVKRRLDALESYARRENETLAEQIRKEQTARTDAGLELSREINDSAKSFERRTAALDEQLSRSQRETRQQLLEQYQRLSDDIRTKVDDVLATLAREAQELRSDKADRAVLASLLNEMAMRLTNDLTIPGVEELGNA
jgi:DNA repair exonuclease SbcCD ATPase subunit